MIGPVQEKETSTRVKAMKKILSRPDDVEALALILLVQEEGSVISKAPKKLIEKTTNRRKRKILNIALVDSSFSALAPKIPVTSSPRAT